ncbi:ribonuclease H-like protein [Wolfiporia cocos MD-104 SS10]|uniref:ribonuclease H n=1 Tax=Wolfiporia cocos (strain MD-104) TaxID=742152 RepID=A0A2H3J7S4_WOLCO|nr:ribonuclease H-like protein [Wolfiporia cocos MD-104 SS10]
MPKASKVSFYAVAKGRAPGVYPTWEECVLHTSGFPGARYKKFHNARDAEAYVASFAPQGSSSVPPAPVSVPAPVVAATSRRSPPSPKRQHARASGSRTRGLAADRIKDESGWTVVFSDGACKGNGRAGSVAGIGVWWGHDDPRNLAERCPGDQTNNRAELIAISRALETAPRDGPLLIKTDSQYSIRCFKEWISKWIRSNWKSSKGEPVKNKALIQYVSALLDQRARAGQKVQLQYVKGHSGDVGNDGADWLANVGSTQPPVPERDWNALRMQVEDERQVAMSAGAGKRWIAPTVVQPETGTEAEIPASTAADVGAGQVEAMDEEELAAYASALLDPDDIELDLMDD